MGPPPSCKQALKLVGISVNINKTLRLAKEFCCFVTTVKPLPLLSGHSTELTIVVLNYVLDKSIHLDVNILKIRPISGLMIVIYDENSPKSLDQSTALHGTLSQYSVTVEC